VIEEKSLSILLRINFTQGILKCTKSMTEVWLNPRRTGGLIANESKN
jgi:hypothetical protein